MDGMEVSAHERPFKRLRSLASAVCKWFAVFLDHLLKHAYINYLPHRQMGGSRSPSQSKAGIYKGKSNNNYYSALLDKREKSYELTMYVKQKSKEQWSHDRNMNCCCKSADDVFLLSTRYSNKPTDSSSSTSSSSNYLFLLTTPASTIRISSSRDDLLQVSESSTLNMHWEYVSHMSQNDFSISPVNIPLAIIHHLLLY